MTTSVAQQACRQLLRSCHGGFFFASSRRLLQSNHRPFIIPPPASTTSSSKILHNTSSSPSSSSSSSIITPVRQHSTTNNNNNTTVEAEADHRLRRLNVGAFGAGRIGRLHLRNICNHNRLRLQWIVEDKEDMRDMARKELNLYDTPFCGTDGIGQLLNDPGLDGVFVLTPTETHATLIMQALEKGKAVFVEKPTAESRAEIEQCYTLAEKKGVHLFTGFQRRLDPVMADLYSAVRQRQAVGKLYNIKTVSRDSPKPSYEFLHNTDPDGCNILSDMGVHDVDMIVWLTDGEEPELIYVVTHAHDEVLAERGIDDSLTVLLKYPSGIIATIDSCRETTYGYDIRVEVFGSKGMAVAENPRETTSVIDGAEGGRIRRLFYSFPQRFEKAFQLEVDHFVRCMDGSDTPPVTKKQALLTARIIEKGVQSFREKRPVYF